LLNLVPKKMVDYCAKLPVPFFLPRFQAVVEKPIWVFQDGQISLRVAELLERDRVLRERIQGVQYYGSQGAIQCRLVDFAQNWYDTHTNEILTLEPPNIIFDWSARKTHTKTPTTFLSR
jgi:hypothetical protein